MLHTSSTQIVSSRLRRVLTAMADGNAYCSRKSIVYYQGLASNSVEYWRYPILTPESQQACISLGVSHNLSRRHHVGGIKEFGAFLRDTEPSILDSLPRGVREESVQGISAFDANEHLKGRCANVARQLTAMANAGIRGVDFYIHGSMADKTDTFFSDVDDLVVIRRKAWSTDANLYKAAQYLACLARLYQSVDPLQHHGHILVTEYDLVNYNGRLFPLSLLSGNGLRVLGPAAFKYHFDTHSMKAGIRDNCVGTANALLDGMRMAVKERKIRAYELKCRVGEILLLPAYVMQYIGKQTSKPEALHQANEFYSDQSLMALHWAAGVRKDFRLIMHSPQMTLLRRVFQCACARRAQAEGIAKNMSPWINSTHPLGINDNIAKAVVCLAEESLRLCCTQPTRIKCETS